MPFDPSEEQDAFFKAITDKQKKSIVLRARAGTGKTTTLFHSLIRLKALKLLPHRDIIATAFGSAIVKELQSRFSTEGVQAKTMHSLGQSALAKHLSMERHERFDTQAGKYVDIIRADLDMQPQIKIIIESIASQRAGNDEKKQKRIAKRLFKDSVKFLDNLSDFGRAKLARWDDESRLTEIAWAYQLDDPLFNDYDLVGELVLRYPTIMKASRLLVETRHLIDFTDMIYWPVYENAHMWAYKCVLVDEIQDINPMQRKLLQMLTGQGTRFPGRILGAGDDMQAIMGFAGADHDSFDLTVEAFEADVLPLTVTRRCGKAIVLFCNDLVEDFKYHESNPDGQIRYIKDFNFHDHVKPGDFVAARRRADLLRAVLGMLAADLPATILGIDLSTWILELFEQLQEHTSYTTFDKVLQALDEMKAERLEEYEEKNDVMGAQNFEERCEALTFMVEAFMAKSDSPNEESFDAYVKNRLGNVLKDDDYQRSKDRYIICSTIHKFKGLEANRVFILSPANIPLVYENQPPEARHQEDCLDYVLRSRAKQEIIYVCDQDFPLPSQTLITLEDLRNRRKQLPLPMPMMTEITVTPIPPLQLPAPVTPVLPAAALPTIPALENLRSLNIDLGDGDEIKEAEIVAETAETLPPCEWCLDSPAPHGKPCDTCQALGANPKWATDKSMPKYKLRVAAPGQLPMPAIKPEPVVPYVAVTATTPSPAATPTLVAVDSLAQKRQEIQSILDKMDADTLDLFLQLLTTAREAKSA